MTEFLGTLWGSVKQNKAPYVSHWEHGIVLHAMQGNRASSLGKGEASLFFWSSGGNLGYILELRRGLPFKTPVCSATSGLLSIYDGQLRILNKACKDSPDASGGEEGEQASISSWHSDIGIPIIFQEESGIITF